MTDPRPVYLDHNATSPLRPEAAAAMVEAMAEPLNASSVHGFGRRARRQLERARQAIAQAAGAEPAGVTFTSGGTEANNLALLGLEGPVVVSAIEHASVLEAVPEAARVAVHADGVVDLDALEQAIVATRPGLVSLMLANNETGVVQPVAAAAKLAHEHGALLHVDAAQALGRTDVDMRELGADLMTLSAHKMGGPLGVGALVTVPGIAVASRQRGGAQESRRRGGTENLPAILGWAAAVSTLRPDEPARLATLRDLLEAAARAGCPEVEVVGAQAERLPNTSCLLLPGVENATQLMALDLAEIAVSSGAACSSGKVGASHVLLAMGMSERAARCAIRVSLGWSTTEADVARFVEVWCGLARRARKPLSALADAVAGTT